MARPKEFDRNDVLQKAMKIFWAKGYEGTSVADLTAGMGISRSSLYETFGDKPDLFREALEHYQNLTGRKRAAVFAAADSVKQGMTELLGGVIRFALDKDLPGGCFYTNTATALGTLDEHILGMITAGAARLEEDIFAFLVKGQESGEIAPEKDCRALARFFVGVIRGMSVVARVNGNREVLEDMATVALETLT
ncbi:TetR/AcrR family transcriptional regulator [Anaeroselena agilis]|uniref:TetR/AcrR family transcriptional regulator n=1 Tax=Anaeroselena agilis TaxID=3063788 RepID=A0ABU3P3A2_9FIRM|nr:TetR/AcrR family transcriptional regulator [Selenomonadales bacterium 4137-cl]